MGSISVWHMLIVLAIVILLFGTKRLQGMGGDIGATIKAFRSATEDSPETVTHGDRQKTPSES